MGSPPQISVLMPVYNGERFIGKAVESILNQSFTDYELIIIDDGSTDTSINILELFRDSRIRLIRNESNWGLIKSRNRGISESRGKYVAFLDCDDIALRHRLEIQYEFLEENPGYDLVGSWIALIDDKGRLTGGFSRYEESADAIPSILLFDNYFAQSAVMAKRDILARELYRDEFPCAEDYDLFSRIASYAKTWNIPKALTLYREHGGGISKKRRDLLIDCTKKIYSWQLNGLGVDPTPEELEIHASLGCFASTVSSYDLNRVREWLLKLYSANQLYNKFNRQQFGNVILEKMALPCVRDKNSVLNLLTYYLTFADATLVNKIKILLKITKRNIAKKLYKLKILYRGIDAFA